MTEPNPSTSKTSSSAKDAVPLYKTVRELRRAWKPHKSALPDTGYQRDTAIRVHRACSWLDQVEKMDDTNHDHRLILLWISFNTLYGTWDPEDRTPEPDATSWAQFLKRILTLDKDDCLAAVLRENKGLVMSLLEDEYLSRHFWRDPTPQQAGKSKRIIYNARTWYVQKQWGTILNRVMERVYFARCQLVHGAATYGGKLNRVALRRSATMLGHLQPAFMTILINYGVEENWGLMCYPPLNQPDDYRPDGT